MSHNPNNHHKNYTHYSKMNNESVVNDIPEVKEDEWVPDACGLNGCGADEIESASNEQPIEGQTVIPEVEPEAFAEPAIKPVMVVEPEPTAEPKIMKIGKVYGCKRLNVREQPSASAAIVSEIDEGIEVMIDEEKSNALFYKICTEHGIEGYCMKKFIAIES